MGSGAAGSDAAAAGSGSTAADSAAGPGAALAGAGAAASGGGAATGTKKRMNLTLTDKTAAVHDLLARSDNGVLRRGAAGEVGEKYGNTGRAMLNLWKRYQQQKAAGVAVPDVSCRRKGNNKRDLSQQKEALQSIPLKLRTTQRSVAASIDLPKTTFRRRMKNLGVKSYSRFLKPALTNACKLDRLRWARSFVSTSAGGTRKFKGMGNVVHVDEKWWYLCQENQRYYVFDMLRSVLPSLAIPRAGTSLKSTS